MSLGGSGVIGVRILRVHTVILLVLYSTVIPQLLKWLRTPVAIGHDIKGKIRVPFKQMQQMYIK